MNNQKAIWNRLVNGPRSEHVLRQVMWRVTSGLSAITGRIISNDVPQVEKIPICQVAEHAGDPEANMVGIYLLMRGRLRGQAILILPMNSALYLVDLLTGQPQGTTTELGVVEHSALAEVGNIAVSRFLSGVASLGAMPDLLLPSPPAVMVNMLGATLDVIVTPVAAVRDDLLIIDMAFRDTRGAVRGRFWVLPDPALLDLAV
jgi:chemotaxis protein CheC